MILYFFVKYDIIDIDFYRRFFMSNKKEEKINEELKRLEDEAYYELCQIIAEAMYTQDIKLLNDRITSWKYKYKKLLNRPSSDSKSDFKRKIEYLLKQYYSEVTQYILNQLKLNEEKKIENQAKAMRELYTLIRDTNDLDLLNKKIKAWKEKYPVNGFLNMYKKRIELYTRQKNLKENAFNQEEAFSDLVEITKIHGTLDELKKELTLWEEKYSINNKYKIDDFIKHQSEVKRFTSDEFLMSIARDDSKNNTEQSNDTNLQEEYENKSLTDLSKQASAYTALLAISKSPNSINEMFKWVYKNRNIKFNDKYKELILSATYLNYSPTYLNKLEKPNLDISKSSLSFEEYQNIGDIKKYAIISYFNLLLPPDKAVSNDFFNKNIRLVYEKSEKARTSKNMNDNATSIEDLIDSGIEFSLNQDKNEENANSVITINSEENTLKDNVYIKNNDELDNDESSNSIENIIEIRDTNTHSTLEQQKNLEADIEPDENDNSIEQKDVEEVIIPSEEIVETEPVDLEKTEVEADESDSIISDNDSTSINENNKTPVYNSTQELNYSTIVAFSPKFFEAVYNLNNQAIAVGIIDKSANEYVERENLKNKEFDKQIKIKNDSE